MRGRALASPSDKRDRQRAEEDTQKTPLGALGMLYPFLVARCLEDKDIASRTKFRGELMERSHVLGFMDKDSKSVVGFAEL